MTLTSIQGDVTIAPCEEKTNPTTAITSNQSSITYTYADIQRIKLPNREQCYNVSFTSR